MDAIQPAASQISVAKSKPVETGSNGLGFDRSKIQPWVPKAGFYGDLPLLVGFDSEWQAEGDTNRVLSYLLRLWDGLGIDRHAVLGTEVVESASWSKHLHRRVRRRETVPTAERFMFESFTTECYHGGRNEQYFFGAGTESIWSDWDLSGAYTTALSLIGLPDWKSIRQTRDLDDFQPATMGYARVRFRFPVDTRFGGSLVSVRP